jgi:hypothetical protein
MIKITINNRNFKGVYRWNDITLNTFCKLAAIPIPEAYESFINIDGRFDADDRESIDRYMDEITKITEKELNETFPEFYRKVIGCLSDIPASLIEMLTPDQVTEIYDKYFKPFVLSLIYHSPVVNFMGKITKYIPEDIKSFRIGLTRYYLPKTVNIMDQDYPLKDETIESYTDVADVFRGMKISKDDVNRLAIFMSVYCRPKNEEYSDIKVIKREKIFLNVPMSIVWSVFFYTCRRLPSYKEIILLFGTLPKPIREVVELAGAYKSMAVVE